MAQLDRGEGHLLDRGAAVGPVGVGVQVALEHRPDLVAAVDQPAAGLALQLGQPLRRTPLDRGGDHVRGGEPIPESCLSVPLGDTALELAVRQREYGRGCGAERLDLVGLRPDRSSRNAIRRSAATGPASYGSEEGTGPLCSQAPAAPGFS